MGKYYLFVKHFMEKSLFILHMPCMCVLVFQRKPFLHLMNMSVFYEQIQVFETCNISMHIILSKETQKRKTNIQLTNFWDLCHITKHFEN